MSKGAGVNKVYLRLAAGMVLVLSVLTSLVLVTPVSAISESEITTKALTNIFITCYNYSNLKNPYNADSGPFDPGEMPTTTQTFVLPTKIDNTLNNGYKVNCNQAIKGVPGSLIGFLGRYKKGAGPYNPENFGYVPTSNSVSSSYKCFSLEYNVDSGSSSVIRQTSNSVCVPVDASGNIAMANKEDFMCYKSPDDGGERELGYSCGTTGSNKVHLQFGLRGTLSLDDFSGNYSAKSLYSGSINGKKFVDVIEKAREAAGKASIEGVSGLTIGEPYDDPNEMSVSTSYTPKTGYQDGAASTALKYITDNPSAVASGVAFDPTDFAVMYSNYYNQITSKYSDVKTNLSNCDSDPNKFTYAITADGKKWCEVVGLNSTSLSEVFSGRDSSSRTMLKSMTFDKILADWKTLNYDRVDSSVLGNITNNGTITNPGSGENNNISASETSTVAECYQGAGPLGWIACPVLGAIGGVTSQLYGAVEDMLQIPAEKILDRNSGIYVGWATFRNFANILFVIAFAVIILAQLTGFGVSNYNIKKVLPRLIMVAVLVNISYILCQIVVDISNLIGVGIANVFGYLPIPSTSGLSAMNEVGNIFGTVVLLVGLTAVGVTQISLPVAGALIGAYWLPFLISLVGCLISVLFFFILLAARQAGVTILILLAPAAIVCYALPNTKSIFDKWRKLFTSLLIVYPMCSLLMYGGQYAGTLMLAIGNENSDSVGVFYTITAMLVTVMPFFFIPSLLKNSMAMMGNLGMKISNFGRGFGRGAQGLIRGTRAYQDHQDDATRMLKRTQNDRTIKRLDRREARGGSLINRARARFGMPTRPALSDGDIRRRGRAVANNAAEMSELEKSFAATMQNDGSAGNPTIMGETIQSAMAELISNPENYQARARYNAAMKNLVRDDAGRVKYEQALNKAEYDARNLTGKAKSDAIRALKWMGNSAMDYNGGDIKKLAPSLFHRLTADIPNYDEDRTLAASISARDLGDGNFSYDRNFTEAELSKIINSLSPESLAGLDDREIERLNAGLRNGTITGNARSKLIETTNKAFSNPNTRAKIKPKVKQSLSDIANADFISGSDEDRVKALTSASSSSLDALMEGIRDKTIIDSIGDNGAVNNSRSEIVKTVRQTLQRAADPADNLRLSTDSASRMMNILREASLSGDTTALSGMVDSSTGQWDEKYQQLTGMKIQHERMSKLSDHPEQWRQATAQDVSSMHGQLDGSRLKVGDWIKTVETSGPPTSDGQQPTRVARMSSSEIRAAEKLQEREADALLEQSDEQYHSQKNQNNS